VDPRWASIPGASWIWPYYRVDSADKFGPYDFKKEFALPDDISDAAGSFQISSDDIYTLYINGELIADNVDAVGVVNTYQFTPLPELNVIEITAFNILGFGVNPESNPAGIIYRADINFTMGEPPGDIDGETTTGTTDSTKDGTTGGTQGSDCSTDIFAEAGKNGLEESNPTRSFGDSDEVNYWIPFSFRISNPDTIQEAKIFMKVKPIGNLIGTDTLVLKGASGKGYVVYDKFDQLEASQWNEPEGVDISGYDDVMEAIKTGKLEGMIQDDTAVSWVILNVCY
jgi:hypothetical protein